MPVRESVRPHSAVASPWARLIACCAGIGVIAACSSSPWRIDQIAEGGGAASTRLLFHAQQSPLEIALLRTATGEIEGWIQLQRHTFSAEEVEIQYTSTSGSYTYKAPVLKGGMRAKAPSPLVTQIVESLKSGSEASILVDRIEQKIPPSPALAAKLEEGSISLFSLFKTPIE